jgi:hypothetical protein
VLLKHVSLASATATLTDPGQHQLAYEMAVCDCDADGRQSTAEQTFIDPENTIKAEYWPDRYL